MKKHFVQFYSPGTFVAEITEKKIDSWDVEKAQKMAHEITERHGATPYGFQFITRERADDELDSRVVKRSSMYFLGGEVFTVKQIEGRNREDERILLQNMKCNDYTHVVINTNSWKWTQPLEDGDVVLNWKKQQWGPSRLNFDEGFTKIKDKGKI